MNRTNFQSLIKKGRKMDHAGKKKKMKKKTMKKKKVKKGSYGR
jgi:hypothetical protein